MSLTGRAVIAIAALGQLAGGCTAVTGRLAVASTRTFDPVPPGDGPGTAVAGRSCLQLFVVVPTGLPSIAEAIDDALAGTGATVLTDVTIRYELRYLPLVYGTACYIAEGRAR